MKEEVIGFLNLESGKTILDCTVGTAGHAQAILEKIEPDGILVGVDCDQDSLAIAREKLGKGSNVNLVHGNFRNVADILKNLGIRKIDGALFDLGVSSLQLDTPQRGFSIKHDAPLDMRMDQSVPLSAYDLVNNLSEKELDFIFSSFGQERWHSRIAHSIFRQRNKEPIATTKELSDIVIRSVPYRKGYWRIHPATRTFQALRIAVNQELDSLNNALEKIVSFLKPGSRICVISFHSLEDRIVKNKFKDFAKNNILKILTKKPLIASDEEVNQNPRSRSAKLRVAERI